MKVVKNNIKKILSGMSNNKLSNIDEYRKNIINEINNII